MFNFKPISLSLLKVSSAALCALSIILMPVVLANQSARTAQPTKQVVVNNANSGLGRAATEQEVRAWDIDVRADFKGLPPGRGTVQQGQKIWDAQCASCHGTFGESNDIFTPLVGGTTKADMKSGRVAGLTKEGYRSTLMKVATLSTLWDYINRAMPWNAPKSLSSDEVYAVTAYMLHLGDILPAEYTLSDKNIAQVQAMMPNRNGMSRNHGLWAVNGKPDVRNTLCMTNCIAAAQAPTVSTNIPEYARDAHGNLADQMRLVGGVKGVVTVTQPANAKDSKPSTVPSASTGHATAPALDVAKATALAQQYACTACHAENAKIVGPSLQQLRTKYSGQLNVVDQLTARAKAGSVGVWGQIPMPAQEQVPEQDLKLIVQWMVK